MDQRAEKKVFVLESVPEFILQFFEIGCLKHCLVLILKFVAEETRTFHVQVGFFNIIYIFYRPDLSIFSIRLDGPVKMLVWLSSAQPENSRFLLLDRDGILNVDRPDYIKSFEEVCFYGDALEAIKHLNRNDIGVILISNQSGVNRGLISWSDFWGTHEGIIRRVEEYGGSIAAAFYCPHSPDERCECRNLPRG